MAGIMGLTAVAPVARKRRAIGANRKEIELKVVEFTGEDTPVDEPDAAIDPFHRADAVVADGSFAR